MIHAGKVNAPAPVAVTIIFMGYSVDYLERAVLFLAIGVTAPLLWANTNCNPPPAPLPDAREPCANSNPLRQPFFGDLHVHTSSSLDAATQGTRLGPDGAYSFAKGATVDIQPYDENGNALRNLTIDRPLDFAMVSDHAEFFGEISFCTTPGSPTYDSTGCILYRESPQNAFYYFNLGLSGGSRRAEVCGEDGQLCFDESITLWDETKSAAEAAYDRTATCSFTSFVGYEWTNSVQAKNLHRNVVFRNTAVPTRPASFFEAPEVEALWDSLETDCVGACEFLTIPHNSNLSQGTFFDLTDRDGNPYTEAVSARRQLHEPLIEIIQHKGQSECIPGSSPADELCDFEVMPFNNLQQAQNGQNPQPALPQDFVRDALKEGLVLQNQLGANPFKYGMAGGTDTHLGTPGAVSEEDYPGHGGAGSAAATQMPPGLTDNPYFNPGGLTVIWAEENSRDSLFDAMRRREVYATSGSRPEVRFFAGWSSQLDANLCSSPTMIEDAYAQGVPMGSDLPQPPVGPGAQPRFFVTVQKDPMGVDIQRVELVKVTSDVSGTTEQVIDIAGDPNNGASVDLNTCQPQGAGFAQLCTVFTDSSFDPLAHSFYYVRVIENPSCRWQQYQCNAAGVDCADPATVTQGFGACCDQSVPDTVQERAWTSPIWYAPQSTPPAATATEPGDILVLQRNSSPDTEGNEIVRLDAEGSNPTSLYSFGDLEPFSVFDMEVAGPNTVIVSAFDTPTLSTVVNVYEVDLLNGSATTLGSFVGQADVWPYLAVEPNGDVLVSSKEGGNGVIKRLDRSSGAVSTAWTDSASYWLLMLSTDADGNVVAVRPIDGVNDEIIRIDLATDQVTVLNTTGALVSGTRLDVDGRVFSNATDVAPYQNLVEIDPLTLQSNVLFGIPSYSTKPFAVQRNGVFRTHLLYHKAPGIVRRSLDTGVEESVYNAAGKTEVDVAVIYPECSDGLDNDGDGAVDFPDDTMCANQLDNHE